MKQTNRILSAIALAAISAGPLCASVTSDYDHNANFRAYHTFSFMKVQSDDPFVSSRLQDEMVRDLGKAGYTRVDSGGDLQITAFEGEHDTKQYNTFYEGLGGGGWGWGGGGGWYGGGWGGGWGGGPFGGGGLGGEQQTTVREIPVGTLVVDMYDNKTKQIVWRGRATSELSKNADKNTKKFDKDIDHMLNGFPPPTKG